MAMTETSRETSTPRDEGSPAATSADAPRSAETSRRDVSPRRGWAYAGVAVGGAVSVAANVAHSYVPPEGAPEGWAPEPGAVFGAVFWPVALFVAIEILARTDWPDAARWVWLRFAGLVPVAAVAAVVSYRHLSGLLAWYHEDWLTVRFGPLAVDGLMVMATGALIAVGSRAREPVLSRADEHPEPAPVSTPDEPPILELVSTPPEPPDEHPDEALREPVREPPVSTPGRRRVSPAAGGSRRRKVTASTLPCDCGCGGSVSRATRTRHRAAAREAATSGVAQ